MKTFEREMGSFAQGDVLIEAVPRLPKKATIVPIPAQQDGTITVAHSETGHHHLLVADRPAPLLHYQQQAVMHDAGGDLAPFVSYVVVPKAARGAVLRHQREYHPHEAVHLPPGVYRVTRQREHVFAAWRPAVD